MKLSGFHRRLRDAVEFEQKVIAELTLRGWLAEPFGQGQLSDDMREILRDIPTPVRGMPDIIAGRRVDGIAEVKFIDAKAGEKWRMTGNHDVETFALENAEEWERMSGCPVYFVFTDARVIRPSVFREHSWDGSYRGRGSGTPFRLVRRDICEHFDDVFGQRDQWIEAV